MGNILVIEDEEHIRKLIEIVLTKQGHVVKQASGAEEAMELLSSEVTDEEKTELILLDIMLGTVDGLDFLQKIKKSERFQTISVMMITSISQQSTVMRGIKLGAEGYIKKPFHPQTLLERVSKFF